MQRQIATGLPFVGSVVCCVGAFTNTIASETRPTGAGPNTAQIETIRECANRKSLRMRVGADWFTVRRARIDSMGVAFDPEAIEGKARWIGDDKVLSTPPASPIRWGAIDRIECRKGAVGRGATLGALIAPLGYMLIRKSMRSNHASTDDEADIFVEIGLVPVGALVGALWGASHPGGEPLWQRPAE
jgi:hypothetical protein